MSVDPEWLEGQAQKLFDNFAGWEQRTLQYIGARIKKTGKMSMADVRVLNNIAVVNQDTDIIFRDLAKVTGYSISELEKIYGAVIESEHNKTKVLHDYRNEPFVPFEENTKLQSMVKAFSKASAEEMINITKTKALGFVDEIGAFHNVKDTLYKALGAATVAVTTGTEDSPERASVPVALSIMLLIKPVSGEISARMNSFSRIMESPISGCAGISAFLRKVSRR